jgi:hypothetical protein
VINRGNLQTEIRTSLMLQHIIFHSEEAFDETVTIKRLIFTEKE